MVGLEERDGRMRSIAGFKGSVARHIIAVTLAFQIAGAIPAFGCCDMEERVLDVDNDNLYDELEQQVFGTKPGKLDSDDDGVADALEDHDADGITNLNEQRSIEALGQAAAAGDIKTVRRLIREGVELDATDPKWELTALARAASSGNLDVMTELLNAGANANAAAYSSGVTPLIAATGNNKAAALRILLDAGADANARNKYGQTALMLAEGNRYTDIVEMLRTAGAKE
jgi:ankyrin repeat protein